MSSCPSEYCISNTSYASYNDYYVSGSIYDGYPTWTGTTNGYYIYFKTSTTQWCLSNTLGGSCLLSGKSPCTTECPDIYSAYLSSGMCLTPTPTPTHNCNILDFNSYFNCSPISFNTPTPTQTSTLTPTPTPTITNYCGSLNVDSDIIRYTPSPTQTPTQTPSPSKQVQRDCSFMGDVTFNTVNININCPISKKFGDCNDPSIVYTTTDTITTPNGGLLIANMVFKALVNGQVKCVHYLGTTTETIGGYDVTLTQGPLGYYNLGGCSFCIID